MIRLSVALALTLCMAAETMAFSIKKKGLFGGWIYIQSYLQHADGRITHQFSEQPQGIFILLPNGWYSHIILRDDMPKIASGKMQVLTPQEAERLAKGSLSHFGRFTVDEKKGSFTTYIHASDFPNFNGIWQTRTVTELSKTHMRYINTRTNAEPGSVVYAHLRRVW